MRLQTSSVYKINESTNQTLVLNSDEEIDTLFRLEFKVPAAQGLSQGSKVKALPTGYFDTEGVWVDYTIADYKFMAVISPDGKLYENDISGASNINKISAIKIYTGSTNTGKIILDSPFTIEQSGAIKFSDFFSTDIPTKLEVFNSQEEELNVELILGLKLEN